MSRVLSIDFIRNSQPGVLGWILLLVGAVTLGGALWLDRQWSAEQQRREAAQRMQTEDALAQARIAAQPRPLTADERRFKAITPHLTQPWLQTLRLIEATTEAPIYLMTLEIDPVNGAIRIDGEAPSFDAVLAYTEQINSPGLLEQSRLRLHEQLTDSPAGPAVRFSATARWVRR